MLELKSKIASTKCVLFDFDGTLVDSRESLLRSFSRFASTCGIVATDDVIAQFDGLTTFEIVEKAKVDWGLVAPLSDLNEVYFALLSEGYSRVVECHSASIALEAVRRAGLKIGLVTSAARALADPVLHRFSWTELFNYKTFGRPGSPGKPNPALYLSTLEQLEFSADEIIVVEDSVAGVRAASAAGLSVMVVSNVALHEKFLNAGAFGVIADLDLLVAALL